jgi:hypothetical protein
MKKMKKTKIIELLDESIKLKKRVSIFRKFSDTRVHGCVLNFSDDFVLVHQTVDFQLDGYAILPMNTLKKVRHIEYEDFYDSIMQKEGILNDLGMNYKIDLTNWRSIFNSIVKKGKFVTIECEDLPFKRFLLGKIENIKKKKVELFYVEADGIMEETITEQKYKEITFIRIDDRYTSLFQKYVKNIPLTN